MTNRRSLSRRSFLKVASAATAATSLSLAGNRFAAAQAQPIVMKLATATINEAQHEWMKRFAAGVEKDSGGRIKGEIYPASQLGSIPRQIEGTQFGQIQGWVGPPEFLAGVDARYEVLSAPGLFKNPPHAQKTLWDPEFSKALFGLGASKGLHGVSAFMYCPASINTRKEVKGLADLKGLKLRVLAASLQQEQIRRMGATPVPMALGDVLPALQQGAIDGVMSGTPVLTAMRFYDAAKFMLESNQSYITVIVVLSKEWFDKLPADLQKVVTDNAQKAGASIFDWVTDLNQRQEKAWIAAGGTITRLPQGEYDAMMKSLASVGDDVLKDKPAVKQMYDLLVAAAKRQA